MSLISVSILASVVEQGREYLNHPEHGEQVRETAQAGIDTFSDRLDLSDEKTQEVVAVLVDDLAGFAEHCARQGRGDVASYFNKYAVSVAAVLAASVDRANADA